MRPFAPQALSCRRILLSLLLLVLSDVSWSNVTFRDYSTQNYTDAPELLMGDLVYTGDGATAVVPKKINGGSKLEFFRLGLDSKPVFEKTLAPNATTIYEPAIAWDGQNYGIAASTLTSSIFLVTNAAGETVIGPFALPNLPTGGRTGGFRIFWTGRGWAVFGMWMKPEVAGASLGQFWSYLFYWLIDANGQVVSQKILCDLAPIAYSANSGAEKDYYDAVWTGDHFFVAYYAEGTGGGGWGTYSRMFDVNGVETRGEAKALAQAGHTATAPAPRLAWSGRLIGLVGWEMPAGAQSATLSARFFNADGTEAVAETTFGIVDTFYGNCLGFNPTISWQGNKFLVIYTAPLGYTGNFTYYFCPFSATGQKLAAIDYPLVNAQNQPVGATLSMGADLKVVGDGEHLVGKALDYDLIRNYPMFFALNGDVDVPAPPIQIAPAFNGYEDNAPVRFQWLPQAKNNNFTLQVARDPAFTKLVANRDMGIATYGMIDLSTPGIEPGTRLYWHVKGSNGNYSDTQSFTVDPNIWIRQQTIVIDTNKLASRKPSAKSEAVGAAGWELAKAFGAPADIVSLNRHNLPQYVRFDWSAVKTAGKPGQKPSALAHDSLSALAPVLKISDASKAFAELDEHTDKLGVTTVRYEQRLAGLPVYGSRLHIHMKDGRVSALTNATWPDLTIAVGSGAGLTAASAVRIARETLRLPDSAAEAQLLWYPAEDGLHKTWQVQLTASRQDWNCLVDASSGRVYDYYSNIQSLSGTFVNGASTNSLGKSVTVPLYLKGGKYNPVVRLSSWDGTEPLNVQPTTTLGQINLESIGDYRRHGYVLLINSKKYIPNNGYDPSLFDFGSTAVTDPMVGDLAVYIGTTLNYFQSRWGWRSWDNNGGGIIAFCHVPDASTGGGFDNAYYSRGYMVFGDGSDPNVSRYFSAAQDVVTHELTHAMTDSSSKLIYQCQSGAINEGMSDIIGHMTDQEDWLIGEDLCKSTDPAVIRRWVRNMQDPTWGGNWNSAHPEYGAQPSKMSQYLWVGPSVDNGGVHINNGIVIKAAYELSTRVGVSKMGDLFFRANTVYLTPGSQFIDLRRALIMAAKDLYPGQTAVQTAIGQAFDVVEVTDPGTSPAPSLIAPADKSLANGEVTLSWSAVAGAKYYLIEASPDALWDQENGMIYTHVLQTPSAQTTLKIPQLGEDGTKFYWRVRSDNGAFSSVREFVYGKVYKPGVARTFTVFSQGGSPATLKQVALKGNVPWLSVQSLPEPVSLPSGGSAHFQVIANPAAVADGTYIAWISVNSSMTTRDPYPGGVTVKFQKGSKYNAVEPDAWRGLE